MMKISFLVYLLKFAWATNGKIETSHTISSFERHERQAVDGARQTGGQGPPPKAQGPPGAQGPPPGAKGPPPGAQRPPSGAQGPPPGGLALGNEHSTTQWPPVQTLTTAHGLSTSTSQSDSGPPPPPPPMPNQRKSWHEEMLVYNLLYSKHQDNDYRTSVRPINMAASVVKLTDDDFIDKHDFISKAGFSFLARSRPDFFTNIISPIIRFGTQSKQCLAYEIERHHAGYHLDNGKNVFQGRRCEDFLSSRLRIFLRF